MDNPRGEEQKRPPPSRPLSAPVISIFKREEEFFTLTNGQIRVCYRSDYVFPSRHHPERHITSMNKAKARLAETAKIKQHWHIHDLRRTAVTKMGELKVPRHIRSVILNHAPNDATDHYDMYEYLDERREALDRWASYIGALIAVSTRAKAA